MLICLLHGPAILVGCSASVYAAEPLKALVDGLSSAMGGAKVEESSGTMENIDLTCGEWATVVTDTLLMDDGG